MSIQDLDSTAIARAVAAALPSNCGIDDLSRALKAIDTEQALAHLQTLIARPFEIEIETQMVHDDAGNYFPSHDFHISLNSKEHADAESIWCDGSDWDAPETTLPEYIMGLTDDPNADPLDEKGDLKPHLPADREARHRDLFNAIIEYAGCKAWERYAEDGAGHAVVVVEPGEAPVDAGTDPELTVALLSASQRRALAGLLQTATDPELEPLRGVLSEAA